MCGTGRAGLEQEVGELVQPQWALLHLLLKRLASVPALANQAGAEVALGEAVLWEGK